METTIAPITATISALRSRLDRRIGERDQLQRLEGQLALDIRHNKRRAIRIERALEIAKAVGLATQKQLEFRLSAQVSFAMDAVFDNPYRLKLLFQERRGKTEADLLFVRDQLEFPPIGSAGGGAIDVAALALRIAYWTMRRDRSIRPVLLLDEPLSQLKGDEHNRRALAVIREISHQLGLQIIMVSDERVSREDTIAHADAVFHVRMGVGGESAVRYVDKEKEIG